MLYQNYMRLATVKTVAILSFKKFTKNDKMGLIFQCHLKKN